MPSTLSDMGRESTQHGEIPFFYAFPIRFFFGKSYEKPDDVLTWCRDHCKGYYKVVCYTHKNSLRDPKNPRKFSRKVIYVDRVYLSKDEDALLIKLTFDVQKTKILRPKIARLKDE